MAETPVIERLKTRPQYLAVAKAGVKKVMPGLVVQFLPPRKNGKTVKVGLTVSGKTGGAVTRNRIKRRLRNVIGEVLPGVAKPGASYVVIGRKAALKRPFGDLKKDLIEAVQALHEGARGKAER